MGVHAHANVGTKFNSKRRIALRNMATGATLPRFHRIVADLRASSTIAAGIPHAGIIAVGFPPQRAAWM